MSAASISCIKNDSLYEKWSINCEKYLLINKWKTTILIIINSINLWIIQDLLIIYLYFLYDDCWRASCPFSLLGCKRQFWGHSQTFGIRRRKICLDSFGWSCQLRDFRKKDWYSFYPWKPRNELYFWATRRHLRYPSILNEVTDYIQ